MFMRVCGVVVAIAVGLLASVVQAGLTVYVDVANCPGPGDGTPENPFCSIQVAIVAAFDGDEIVVAPGTYTETIDFDGKAVNLRSSGGALVTVIDGQGVGRIVTATSDEGPDTILDGFTITGGNASSGAGMLIDGSDPTVQNCTFTNNSSTGEGGAVRLDGSSSVTITNCRFIGNTAVLGAGVFNGSFSHLTLVSCRFVKNAADIGSGVNGRPFSTLVAVDSIFAGNADPAGVAAAGIASFDASLTVDRCLFSGNKVAAIECGGGTLQVTNSIFVGNKGNAVFGGGILDLNLSSLVANCLFVGNFGGLVGGGVYSGNDAEEPVLANCTFVDNDPTGLETQGGNSPLVSNCIFWGNTPEQITGDPVGTPSDASVFYCDVQGGYPGPGSNNIDADPMLAGGPSGTWTDHATYDPATGLTTYFDANASYVPGALAGKFLTPWVLIPGRHAILDNSATTITIPGDFALFGIPDLEYRVDDLRLIPGSPCVDAADNTAVPEMLTTDLDGNPRFLDVPETPDSGNGDPPIVDMGAFESLGGGCLAITSQEVICHGDGSTFTVNAEGLNACTGGTTMVTFTGAGGAVGEDFCATLIVNTEGGGFCCSTELCVPVPDCSAAALPCDFDGDGAVGVLDFLALLNAWGACSDCGDCPADLDGDCEVGVSDFLILLANWA
ncbi:MAG: right-handed parallel beta-helix repeat-containing protein [Planctomycetota bacterium]|jgi:predicted outer membrane repeat protein